MTYASAAESVFPPRAGPGRWIMGWASVAECPPSGSIVGEAIGVLVRDPDLHEVAAADCSSGDDLHCLVWERGECRSVLLTPLACGSMSVRGVEANDDLHQPESRPGRREASCRWCGPVFGNAPEMRDPVGADRWTAHRRTLCRVRQAEVIFVLVLVVGLCGCSDSHTAAPSTTAQKVGLRFVAAPQALLAKCRVTARAVGYPVPCPTYVPAGLAVGSSTTPTGCLDVIGPGGRPACGPAGKSWRGWVVGTSDVGRDHLVITASPKPLTNDAKLVNGPAWYPRARVRTVGWVNIKGWRMRAVYVPPATNDGSAFMHHVVLVWSDAGHTYGVGFHNTRGIRQTLLLDEELAKHITLIEP